MCREVPGIEGCSSGWRGGGGASTATGALSVHPALLRAGSVGRPQRDLVLRARADVLLAILLEGE